MKLKELVDAVKQLKNPQSSGSRGIKLNKTRPPKRYFDSISIPAEQKTKQV